MKNGEAKNTTDVPKRARPTFNRTAVRNDEIARLKKWNGEWKLPTAGLSALRSIGQNHLFDENGKDISDNLRKDDKDGKDNRPKNGTASIKPAPEKLPVQPQSPPVKN